jgi:hypothetical protein
VGDEVRADFRADHGSVRLANTTETFRPYAQRARLGMAAQNRSADLGLRAERKLGQYIWRVRHAIRVVALNPFCCGTGFQPLTISASPGNCHTGHSNWRRSPPRICWYLRTAAAQEWEIITRLLLYYSERRQGDGEEPTKDRRGRIDDLIDIDSTAFQRRGNTH